MKNETILRLAKGCDSPEVANELKKAAAWELNRLLTEMKSEAKRESEAYQYEKRAKLALLSVAGLGACLILALVLVALHIH